MLILNHFQTMPDNKLFDDITELSKKAAIENLLESGVDANFIEPMIERLKTGVMTGSNVSDLIEEMRLYIIGNKEILGTLTRYVKQVSHDSLIQYNRIYHNAIAEATGFVFYRYVGTRIKDTRPFCIDFLNDYFHRKEVEDLGRGIDPQTGNRLTQDQLQGRIKGTNASNIFTNAGGWNCRHEFTAINTQFVPKPVLQRNVAKGNITFNKRQIEVLGL